RQRIEYRGVGVQDLRADLIDHLVEPSVEIPDNLQLTKPGQFGGEPGRHRSPQKLPCSDLLPRGSRRIMLAAREQHRFPAQRPLLVDDAEGPIDISAVQRQRMVENMQNSHYPGDL